MKGGGRKVKTAAFAVNERRNEYVKVVERHLK